MAAHACSGIPPAMVTSPPDLDPLGSERGPRPALEPESRSGSLPRSWLQIPARRSCMGCTGSDARGRTSTAGTIWRKRSPPRSRTFASPTQRVWLREAHRSGHVPGAADDRDAGTLLQAPRRVGCARALMNRPTSASISVLDRGPGHDRCDARRADSAVARLRRTRGGDRMRTRATERAPHNLGLA